MYRMRDSPAWGSGRVASCLRTLAGVWGVCRKDLAGSSVFAKDSKEMKGTDVQTDAPGGGMLGHGVSSLELYILPMDLRHPCGRRTEYGEQRKSSEGGCSEAVDGSSC